MRGRAAPGAAVQGIALEDKSRPFHLFLIQMPSTEEIRSDDLDFRGGQHSWMRSPWNPIGTSVRAKPLARLIPPEWKETSNYPVLVWSAGSAELIRCVGRQLKPEVRRWLG
jgi:hypothetical protein